MISLMDSAGRRPSVRRAGFCGSTPTNTIVGRPWICMWHAVVTAYVYKAFDGMRPYLTSKLDNATPVLCVHVHSLPPEDLRLGEHSQHSKHCSADTSVPFRYTCKEDYPAAPQQHYRRGAHLQL